MKRWDTEGDDAETVAGTSERCSKAIKAADAIVAAVDVAALAAHYGVKHDDVSEAQIDTRSCIS